jgi:hypothetical protein
MNLYLYASSDPLNATDPTGRDCEEWGTCSPNMYSDPGYSINYCSQASCSAKEMASVASERTEFVQQYGAWGLAGMMPNENFDGLIGDGMNVLTSENWQQLKTESFKNAAVFIGITVLGVRVRPKATTTRVGRWMGKSELKAMQNTGRVQESASGLTHVANPANSSTFARQAPKGSSYVEFDVPHH